MVMTTDADKGEIIAQGRLVDVYITMRIPFGIITPGEIKFSLSFFFCRLGLAEEGEKQAGNTRCLYTNFRYSYWRLSKDMIFYQVANYDQTFKISKMIYVRDHSLQLVTHVLKHLVT